MYCRGFFRLQQRLFQISDILSETAMCIPMRRAAMTRLRFLKSAITGRGDKMQKIHWKLSAKSDSLIVKEYSEPVGFAIVIFVNLFSPGKKEDRQKRDAVLETAASLSWTLIEQNYTHIVAWVGERGRIRRRKISDYEDIYEMLAGLLTAQPHEYDPPGKKTLRGKIWGTQLSFHG